MSDRITEEQARAELDKYAARVTTVDVASTVEKEDKYRLLFKHVDRLSKYWTDVKLVFQMLKDMTARRYVKCPWRTITVLVGSLVYVLAPLDLIPDFIPILGWSDDCAVLVAALAFAKKDLDDYKRWRVESKSSEVDNAITVESEEVLSESKEGEGS